MNNIKFKEKVYQKKFNFQIVLKLIKFIINKLYKKVLKTIIYKKKQHQNQYKNEKIKV